MIFQSVQLNNGKILDGDKIGELVAEIVNKFSENGFSKMAPLAQQQSMKAL